MFTYPRGFDIASLSFFLKKAELLRAQNSSSDGQQDPVQFDDEDVEYSCHSILISIKAIKLFRKAGFRA